jgi:partitioning defective protein 3
VKSAGSQSDLAPSSTAAGSSDDRPLNGMVQSEEHMVGASMARVAAVSPTRKPASGIPGTRASALMTVSTRKIGKKFDLELTKGSSGLGFSVTTRDNPAGGQCPIYIKNILPKGAAIEDGRLKSGDRLLEVNGVEITGKSQDEVVTLLRNIPAGGIARLLISRQTDSSEEETSPKLPRQMKSVSRASEESLLLPWKQREILTLDIPVHDTEKAGLGISVKGKTTTTTSGSGTTDLGIFIKSVLHGGAASRDGRLSTNDQLLHVNGVSLLGR